MTDRRDFPVLAEKNILCEVVWNKMLDPGSLVGAGKGVSLH